jgi:aspartate-semialdehyde dehydrogenase
MHNNKWAIVGSDSLLGRELREILSDTPGVSTILIGADAATGLLSEDAGEAVFISPLEGESLAEAAVVLLAGSAESSRKAYDIIAKLDEPPPVVDLSLSLEDRAAARLRAPVVESSDAGSAAINGIAHPASIAISLLLSRLHREHPVRRAIVVVFEPASERGQAGIEELQQQTVALLSFQKLRKEIYDAQLSFNLLPRYGTEARQPLHDVERRIERHVASLLGPAGTPMPSIKLLQAPVFHGHSLSVWVEFEQPVEAATIEEALASAQIEVRAADEEPPSNVGAAGQRGITIAVEADRNERRGCWFWVVADNLRIVAENAIAVAHEITEAR